MDDDAIRGFTVIKDGEITWPAPPLKLPAPPRAAPKPAVAPAAAEKKGGHGRRLRAIVRSSFGAGVVRRRRVAVRADRRLSLRRRSSATSRCSCWPASSATWWCGTSRPALHTPLMSVTNAISSIIAIGALLAGCAASCARSSGGADPVDRRRRRRAHVDQHVRRVRGDPPHADDVPEIRRPENVLSVSSRSPISEPPFSSSSASAACPIRKPPSAATGTASSAWRSPCWPRCSATAR